MIVHRGPPVHQCWPAAPSLKHLQLVSAVGCGQGYDLGAFQRYQKTQESKIDLGPWAWSH